MYLADEHTAPVDVVAFSPNGVYVATGGLDKSVVIWLAERGAAVAKTTLDEVRTCGRAAAWPRRQHRACQAACCGPHA